MTCSVMLDRMLEADLGELRGQGESVVAMHVRECTRCRTVATQLVRDTIGLSQAIHALPGATTVRRRRAVSMSARAAAVAGLAAAIALVVVRLHDRPDGSQPASVVVMRPVTVSSPVAPSVVTAAVAPRVQPRRASTRVARVALPTGPAIQSSAVTVEPTPVASAQRAVAVLPVRIAPAPQQPLGNTVTAEPPAGKRANIIRTDRPGVTVVWLYD